VTQRHLLFESAWFEGFRDHRNERNGWLTSRAGHEGLGDRADRRRCNEVFHQFSTCGLHDVTMVSLRELAAERGIAVPTDRQLRDAVATALGAA
jgi:lipoyl(octanoyl) transferase